MREQPFSTEIVLRKQLSGFQPEVLKRIQEIAVAGYRHALPRLEGWFCDKTGFLFDL
jgi:hypothetical protein